MKVAGITPETLKTVSSEALARLKARSFAVDIRFEKAKADIDDHQMGATALGRLDQAFLQFLESQDMPESEREELKELALQYLASDDQ
jgi:hypothetical protein